MAIHKKNIFYDHLLRIAINSKIISFALRPRLLLNKNFNAKLFSYQRPRPYLKNLYYVKIMRLLKLINTQKQEIILSEIKDVVDSMGFKFSVKNKIVNINAVPPIISDKPIEEIFEDLLNKNDSYNIKESFSLSDLIAKKLSKLLSVKTGKTLKLKEQQAIINQLFSCKEPKLSPFNKQIFVTLDKKYLDKNFLNG